MSLRETIDLGTLACRRRASALPARVHFAAPSVWTRGVWLAGALACLVFVASVAVPLGWLVPAPDGAGLAFGRWPRPLESIFWLLPLVLGALSLALGLGGVRLQIDDDELRLGSGAIRSAGERAIDLETLLVARSWEERSRSREKLYGTRLVFAATEVVWRTADRAAWEALRDRFEGAGL